MDRKTVTTVTLSQDEIAEAIFEWCNLHGGGEVHMMDTASVEFLSDDGQPFEFEISAIARDT